MAENHLRNTIQCAVRRASLPHPEITRIFFEQCRVGKVCPKSARHFISQRRAITFSISSCALAICRKLIRCLADRGLKSSKAQRHRIECRLGKQVKFFFRSERRRILATGHRKLRKHAQHALRLLSLFDFFFLLGFRLGGSDRRGSHRLRLRSGGLLRARSRRKRTVQNQHKNNPARTNPHSADYVGGDHPAINSIRRLSSPTLSKAISTSRSF